MAAGGIFLGIGMWGFPVSARHIGIEHVGVPKRPGSPVLVAGARFFTEAINGVLRRHDPAELETSPLGPIKPGTSLSIPRGGKDQASIRTPNLQMEGIKEDHDPHRRGADFHPVFSFSDLDLGRLPESPIRRHRMGGLILKISRTADLEPSHIRTKKRDPHCFALKIANLHFQSMRNSANRFPVNLQGSWDFYERRWIHSTHPAMKNPF